jgi:hypothetical protein
VIQEISVHFPSCVIIAALLELPTPLPVSKYAIEGLYIGLLKAMITAQSAHAFMAIVICNVKMI